MDAAFAYGNADSLKDPKPFGFVALNGVTHYAPQKGVQVIDSITLTMFSFWSACGLSSLQKVSKPACLLSFFVVPIGEKRIGPQNLSKNAFLTRNHDKIRAIQPVRRR